MGAADKRAGEFKPYRHSEIIRDEKSGQPRLMLRAGVPNSEGPSLEDLMASGDTITPGEIAEWFVPLRFEPAPHDLTVLAEVLNKIRVTRPQKEAVPDPLELQAVAGALATLADNLPALIDNQTSVVMRASQDKKATARDVTRRIRLTANLNALQLIVRVLRADPFMIPGDADDRRSWWHRDLRAIAFLLAGIARKHGATISLTKAEAPAVGLLKQALARTGISKSCDAIAQELKRSKGKHLREFNVPES